MAFLPVQSRASYSLAGAGAVAGATTVILKSFQTIDGVNLVMADFGVIGYATLEPGNSSQEEQISFTGITQNANGTATLTGVKTVLFVSPYTETSGLAKTHPGSSSCVISNTTGFYEQFAIKQNDETIDGQWTFTNTPIVPGTVSNASTTVKGVSKLSVAAASATDPIVVGTNDNRVFVGYAVDSVGTDSYAITPTPAITAYSAGQVFTFKAGTANTGAATLAVSGLSPIAIKKNATQALDTGDIIANQIVVVEYDGTNMQMVSPTAASTATPSTDVQTFLSTGTWTKPASLNYTMAWIQCWGGGAGGAFGGSGNVQEGGGGGGGYNELTIPLSSLGATEAVTIGNGGGPGLTTGNNWGLDGDNTTFGSWLTGYGGGGGALNSSTTDTSGGGGGGLLSKGANGGNGSTAAAGSPGAPFAGAGTNGAGGNAWAGAAGGGVSATVGGAGGNAVYGGGGGGGSRSTGSQGAGGTSLYGGAGGAAINGTGVTGSVPGGGGGGGQTLGGSGGKGKCIVTVY